MAVGLISENQRLIALFIGRQLDGYGDLIGGVFGDHDRGLNQCRVVLRHVMAKASSYRYENLKFATRIPAAPKVLRVWAAFGD
jgi:hypothetical protein